MFPGERGVLLPAERAFFRAKPLLNEPENERLSLVFLPRNERFQSLRADLPSGFPSEESEMRDFAGRFNSRTAGT